MTGYSFHIGLNDYSAVRSAGVEGFFANLLGSVNDAVSWKAFAREQLRIEDKNQVLASSPVEVTKSNVLQSARDMVDSLVPGDQLLVTWSGHGVQVPTFDASTTEPDGLDECLVTSDFSWDAPLKDGEFGPIFNDLPAGCCCTLIVDTCHSGSITRAVVGRGEEQLFSMIYGRGVIPPSDIAAQIEMLVARRVAPSVAGVLGAQNDREDVVVFAACAPNELAKEVFVDNAFHGAFSLAMLHSFRQLDCRSANAAILLDCSTRVRLFGATQTPQLETSAARIHGPFWPL